MNELTMDDLLLLLGHKEATLAVVSRQARALIAERDALKAELAKINASQVAAS